MRGAGRDLLLSVVGLLLVAAFVTGNQKASANVAPVAEAGSLRYAAEEPIYLDGTGSYDPDASGPLQYTWTQVSGPTVTVSAGDTAMPMIEGFTQTDEIQECEFQLVVSDGTATSEPDAVKVVIVPQFVEDPIRLWNWRFCPHKPTLVYFGGGDCIYGTVEYAQCPVASPEWLMSANVLSFPQGYSPDPNLTDMPTYYHLADQLITYLSGMAPDYHRPIQAIGWSTGTQPAIDVGVRLNRVYQDARYTVNRVTHLDATCRTLASWGGSSQRYNQDIEAFVDSAVNGEPTWVDHYWGRLLESETPEANVLAAYLVDFEHEAVRNWYGWSLTAPTANQFSEGRIAGAYWSVIGAGRNLQRSPEAALLFFHWEGDLRHGRMAFADESTWPGTLPEPVTPIGPVRIGQTNDIILTCKESHNAIGYQFLLGSDPNHIMDFQVLSDTPGPPQIALAELPSESVWWTVRVYDRFGSAIHADPVPVPELDSLSLRVRNATMGRDYASLGVAMADAEPRSEIVVQEGIYHEHVDFMGKSLTLRSKDPNDPAVVAATVVAAAHGFNGIVLSGSKEADSTLSGLTITDANTAVFCSGPRTRIERCRIIGNHGFGVALAEGSSPVISHCVVAENGSAAVAVLRPAGSRLFLYSQPMIENCTIARNAGVGISGGQPRIRNSIIYFNRDGILSDSATVSYSNIQGGWEGQSNLDTDPLFVDVAGGDYHLKSEAGHWDVTSKEWLRDDVTSPCIDAGDPNVSFASEIWPHGQRINMGAYGGTHEASMSTEPVSLSLPRIIYIYWWDREKAESYRSFLTAFGCSVQLVQSNQITPALDDCDLLVIGPDTHNAPAWTDGQSVAILNGLGKPVVGLGEGGYRFFGRLGLAIGYPNGARTSRDSVYIVDPNTSLVSMPYPVAIPADRVLQLYTHTDHVTVYLWPVPQTVTAFAREADTAGCYPVVAEQGRYLLWGFIESPERMTETGRALFLNAVILTANDALGAEPAATP